MLAPAPVQFDDVDRFMQSSGRCIQVALADKRECQVAQHDGLGLRVIAVSRGSLFEQTLRAPGVLGE